MSGEYELKDLEMRVVPNETAKSFIQRYHYSKKCPVMVVALGEFVGVKMVNCIVFNYCVSRGMAKQVLKGGDNTNTIELTRMVSLEPKPKNLESYCISKALKWLKENMPNIKVVISYVDNGVGHHGYCYQASGFTYYGQSRAVREHYVDGKRVHEKTLFNIYGSCAKSFLKEKLGNRYELIENNATKSRYYKIIAQSKREYKEIKKNILVESLPYPKGDNQRYDINIKGKFMELDEEKAQEQDTREVIQQLTLF